MKHKQLAIEAVRNAKEIGSRESFIFDDPKRPHCVVGHCVSAALREGLIDRIDPAGAPRQFEEVFNINPWDSLVWRNDELEFSEDRRRRAIEFFEGQSDE